jgi:hypothetical protein
MGDAADGEVASLHMDRKIVMSVLPPVASVRVTTQAHLGSSSGGVKAMGGGGSGGSRVKKGILRKNGAKRKLSVTFPKEVREISLFGLVCGK